VITGAAFCPHPPVLLPEVAQGAAPELAELRSACRAAIARVVTPGSAVLLLGAGERWRRFDASARGSLAGFGVDAAVPLGDGTDGPAELPLSLTVGAWLLRDAVGPVADLAAVSVGPDPDGASALDGDGRPTALLVLGDGSARRSAAAPGYLDERAERFDAAVAAALAGGDPERLRVDVPLADAMLAAGARTWHVAAQLLAGRAWSAELLHDSAPYGVGYFAAAWIPA